MIQSKTNYNTSFNSAIGGFNSTITAPIKNTFNKTWSIAKKINDSIVGGYLINSSKENILECAGALTGAALGEWVLSKAMENLGSVVGFHAGLVSAVGLGILSGKALYNYLENDRDSSQDQSNSNLEKSVVAATNVSLASLMILPNAASNAGAIIGSGLGAFLGAQAGAILGGYAAIHAYGSDEALIDYEKPENSYVVKTLQATTANNFIGLFIRNNAVIQTIQDQILGSLAYHSYTEIGPVMKSIKEGTLLDGLPQNLQIEQKDKDLIESGIKKTYKNQIYRDQVMGLPISQGANKQAIEHFFNQDVDQLFEDLKSSPLRNDIPNEEQLINSFARAFNEYCKLIHSPRVHKQQGEFIKAFLNYKNAKPEDKNHYLQQMNSHKNELIKTLNDKTKYLISRELDNKEKQILSLIKSRSPTLIQKLTNDLEKLEEQTFAFPITDENLKSLVKEILQIHSEFLLIFTAIEVAQSNQTVTDNETMRQNYIQTSSLLASYYSLAVDYRFPAGFAFTTKKLIAATENLLHSQITTAKLRDSKLSDYADLEELVDSL